MREKVRGLNIGHVPPFFVPALHHGPLPPDVMEASYGAQYFLAGRG